MPRDNLMLRRRSYLLFLSAIVCLVIALGNAPGVAKPRVSSSTSSTDATLFYVAPNGSDSNPGTVSAPWKTVLKGLLSLKAGDTLYVRDGRYRERIRNPAIRSGSSSAPITVAAYSGERPVIEGLLWLKGASHWSFKGINVTWSDQNVRSEHMVKFTNGVGWSFTDAEVWGARSYANFLVVGTASGQPSNWMVARNCIHDTYPSNDTNQDHNIYVNSGLTAGPGLIRRNLIFNATNGENIKIGSPGVTTSGSANVTVRYNTMHNAAQNMLLGNMTHDIEIYRNILSQAKSGYPNIRGYQLTGLDNWAHDNFGWAAKSHIRNDPGYVGVSDGGGNQFPVDPQFGSTADCDRFHTLNPSAAEYGRYGVSWRSE